MSDIRLKMMGIGKRFGATVALDGVDFSARPGKVVALVGENGAGKSTLMKVLSGAIEADAGSMELEGKPFKPGNPLAARRAGVAMIYQELSIAPDLSVAENVLLGVEPTKCGLLNWKRMCAQARAALEQLGRGDLPMDVPAGSLSVAEQQITEIARALVLGAGVLVFDEPSSSLAQDDVQRLFELIDRLREQGLAIVYISHFLEEVQRVADEVVVLRDGRTVGGGLIDQLTNDQIIALMVGRQVDDLYPRSERETGDVVLELNDLAGVSKPRDASLTLRRGEVLGISGLVGAGRTEMARALFGLDPVRSGEVRVMGLTGRGQPNHRWQQGVGYVSEDRKVEGLALSMTVADNMTLSHLTPFGPAGWIRPAAQRGAADRWIDRMDVRCAGPGQPIGDLSGGNQQKVAIARLLHHDVDVLVLDEPTRGIDVASKATIYQLIDELALAGKAILLVSSYLPELLGVCDRVAVMCRGELGEAKPVDQWDEHSLMVAATGQEQVA